MSYLQTTLLALLMGLFLWSCTNKDEVPFVVPDPLPEADIVLDDLVDMEDYAESMKVDCRYFDGKWTSRILVNQTEYISPEIIDFNSAGYYRIEIYSKASPGSHADVIRMVILDPERGQTEWGLAPWTPQVVKPETIGSQEIQMIYPRNVPTGYSFPLVVLVDGQLTRSTDNLKGVVGSNSFLIKRGVGSIWVPPGNQAPDQLVIDHRTFPIQTGELAGPSVTLSGEIPSNMNIPSGSHVNITGNLTIPSGINLTIEAGCFVSIYTAVNIYNQGSILIKGSEALPVTFTCSNPASYWGGVIGTGSGNLVEASHTIFSRSGYHNGGEYDWGHAHRQALFFCENGSLSLDHCYMIDHVGQISYTENASLMMESCLVQRAKTGGQLNDSNVSISRSVFTDFPDDSQDYRDNDNDGLYLIGCFADISNSVFMYAKDDGLDSGGGASDGVVRVSNTRFEAIFHEGAALSGGANVGKNQYFTSCVFSDCGQGLELGYSSRAHFVFVDSCSFLRNGVGIRYGDCYEYPNDGYLSVSNSESIDNRFADVWNMDREDWVADTLHMEFHNVWVSKGDPMYPELKILE